MAVHSRDIISRTSIDGVRQWVSDSVTEVLGWRPEELLGDRTIRVIHPDDAPGMIAVFEKMRNGLTTATLLYRARTRQGTYIPLEGHLRMLREPISGQPHEVVINSRDITDRVAAEEELKAAYAAMQRLAATDPLTGLANRRVFDEMLDREWRRGLREVSPLAVLLFDVDYFKRYNDALGHQAGDECLRIIAHCLADIVQRPGDLTARYGGEEFIALLPGTDVSGAVHIASRIQDALRRQAVPHPDSDCGQHLTLSMGVAALVPHIGMEAVHLVRAADRALYSAKKLGRNRLEIAVSPCDLVQSALTDSADSADSAVADDTATVGND
jgi:diguanylate cyclase (GGDEF)-like protein/PAS domain S-box-containing protein